MDDFDAQLNKMMADKQSEKETEERATNKTAADVERRVDAAGRAFNTAVLEIQDLAEKLRLRDVQNVYEGTPSYDPQLGKWTCLLGVGSDHITFTKEITEDGVITSSDHLLSDGMEVVFNQNDRASIREYIQRWALTAAAKI